MAAVTGQGLRTMRETLQLSVSDFAKLLGVHPTAVYRWEGEPQRVCPVENTLTRRLLTLLDMQVREKDKLWRASLHETLLVQGPLAALHYLIDTSKHRSRS
jgi:predicted transcriptional regulator